MIYLAYYASRNLKNEEDVFSYLMNTLRESIFTWSYFVDFEKVDKNISSVKRELLILNNLIGLHEEDIEREFINIITDYPNVRKALPILIALRRNKLKDRPIIDDLDKMLATTKQELFNPQITINQQILDDLVVFFKESGLHKFVMSTNITNFVDYCTGVEVGMDTNARKNRTGTNMEDILERFLKSFCFNFGFKYMSQATKNKIENEWGISIEVDKIARRFDFAILSPTQELTLMEVNYYSSGGSKLKATAGEYKSLQTLLSVQGYNFVWVTDGLGWNTAKTALYETFLVNDFTFNLEMVKNGILEEALINNSAMH